MRKVVLTALAILVFVTFTFSGCKKTQPPAKQPPAVGKTTPKAPSTPPPEKPAPAPAPAPTTPEKPATTAPATPPATPATK